MDQWVQKLSLAVLMVVVGLCFYGTNRKIACHTPAHFESDHSKYAHQACAKPDSATYIPLDDSIPHEKHENDVKQNWTSHIDTKSTWLLKLVFVEVIVVCTAYCLLELIVAAGRVDAQSPHKKLHKSYFKVPLYFLIQVVSGICWVAFTMVSNQENEWPTAQSVFMCDYGVRHTARVHTYTIQCVDDHDHLIRVAYMINFGLAFVVSLTKLIHVVSALLIAPFLQLKAARAVLLKSGVIQNPMQLGAGFALSDLYFAMLTSGKGSTVPNVDSLGSHGEQGGRSKDTE